MNRVLSSRKRSCAAPGISNNELKECLMFNTIAANNSLSPMKFGEYKVSNGRSSIPEAFDFKHLNPITD